MQATRKILVVDDDVPTVDFITEVLRDEGYAVHAAADAVRALAAIEAEHPDAILLDLRMPRLSGAELFRQLQRRGLVTIPIILMTADNQAVQELIAQGVKFILLKPFDLTTLLECVARALVAPAETRHQATPPQSHADAAMAAEEAHICT